jgi:hypothetical protein
MKLIMKFVGEPTDNDLSFLTEDAAISYLKEVSNGFQKQTLEKQFP